MIQQGQQRQIHAGLAKGQGIARGKASSVITSYSIHYTKLYDSRPQADKADEEEGQAKSEARPNNRRPRNEATGDKTERPSRGERRPRQPKEAAAEGSPRQERRPRNQPQATAEPSEQLEAVPAEQPSRAPKEEKVAERRQRRSQRRKVRVV